MFANLLQLITRRSPGADYDLAFVKEVNIRQRPIRNSRMERIILLCWLLIAVKAVLLEWAVRRYAVPIDAMWVVAPTVAMALMCTALYYFRK